MSFYYINCPNCLGLRLAVIVRELRAQCCACGFSTLITTATRSQCSCRGCGSVAYSPPGSASSSALPCHLSHPAVHHAPAASLALSARPVKERSLLPAPTQHELKSSAAVRTVPCAHCSARIPIGVHGQIPPCPVCSRTPGAGYISRQLYYARSGLEPIQLTWRPEGSEICHEHAHSDHIPPLSLLIVDPNQQAVYISGGQALLLSNGVYPLYGEEQPTTAEVHRMLSRSQIANPLTLQLHTRLIFFDARWHACRGSFCYRLPALSLAFSLMYSYRLRVSDAAALMCCADAMASGEKLKYLSSVTQRAVNELLSRQLDRMLARRTNLTPASLRPLISECCEKRDFSLELDSRLQSAYGISMDQLDFSCSRITFSPL